MYRKTKKLRIFIGIAVPLVLIAGAVYLYIFKQGPGCAFYKMTGIYCPGCGMGRAAVALLHLDFPLAFRNNPLMILLLPFILYYLLKMYIAYVFGKDILPFFEITTPMAVVLAVVVVLFWILRNIPIEPFTYLAPI